MALDEMALDEMALEEMTIGQMALDEMAKPDAATATFPATSPFTHIKCMCLCRRVNLRVLDM